MRSARVLLAVVLMVAAAPWAVAGQKHRAAIDMGSSSIKLLVVNGRGRTVVDERIGVALGKGIGSDKLLPKKNQQRAVKVLKRFIKKAARYGIPAKKIELIATAAVRNATGPLTAKGRAEKKTTGTVFVADTVKGRLGLERAQILSGDQEAHLGHQAALLGLNPPAGAQFVVVDTGGGSHQVIVGTLEEIVAAGSTQIGSNLIVEKVLIDDAGGRLDVATEHDLAAADRRMAEVVPALPVDAGLVRGSTPVVIGGLANDLRHFFRSDIVTRAQVEALRRKVSAVPLARRRAVIERDVSGKRFSKRERKELGLRGADARGTKLPAKLTLMLRIMTLMDAPALRLSETDARHALVR